MVTLWRRYGNLDTCSIALIQNDLLATQSMTASASITLSKRAAYRHFLVFSLLIAALMGLISPASSQDFLSSNRTNTNLLAGNDDDFLPVTEAFK